MKRTVVLVLVMIAVLTTSCGIGRPSDATCNRAQEQMLDNSWEKLSAMQVNMLLNNNFPPDTVGATLQDCINGGWEGYR